MTRPTALLVTGRRFFLTSVPRRGIRSSKPSSISGRNALATVKWFTPSVFARTLSPGSVSPTPYSPVKSQLRTSFSIYSCLKPVCIMITAFSCLDLNIYLLYTRTKKLSSSLKNLFFRFFAVSRVHRSTASAQNLRYKSCCMRYLLRFALT